MKFGAVTPDQLEKIDLNLPPDPFINQLVLPGSRAASPKAYIGAATWGSSAWSGTVYPSKTPLAKFRQLYPRYFNAIELNATHYRIYDEETLGQWAAAAKGRDFRFCPKFPQEISHYSHFQNTAPSTEAFLKGISAFGNNLGPSFLQLSENFSAGDTKALYQYLSGLPSGIPFFVEFRHPQFFSDEKQKEEAFDLLRILRIGAVITDAPGRRDVVHMQLTHPKIMIRFVCNGLHPSSFTRTQQWGERLAKWFDAGLEEAYVFLHPGEDAVVPRLASYWTEVISNKCGIAVKDPTYEQKGLFGEMG